MTGVQTCALPISVKIQPEVEKVLGGSVNPNTIVVAIKRYADTFEQKDAVSDESVLKDVRLSVTDGVMDVNIPRESFKISESSNLFDEFSKLDPNFEFFRLPDTFRFLTEDFPDVRKLFESLPNAQSQFRTGLTKIIITIPQTKVRSDVGTRVTELFRSANINWDDAYFSKNKMIITLNSKDAAKAYDILRSEISR